MYAVPTIGRNDLYRRSPFQVGLLLFCTFGLYLFYWHFKVRRYTMLELERDDSPGWKTVALIIPIFNLFLLFDLFQRIKGVNQRATLPIASGFAWLGILGFAIALLWRLPAPYWLASSLSFIPFLYGHEHLKRARFALHGVEAAYDRFMWLEWVLIVVFGLLYLLDVVAMFLPNIAETAIPFPFFGVLVTVVAIVVLFLFKRRGDALTATALNASSVPVAGAAELA